MQFDPPLEEGRLVRRYKRFLADIVTAGGEALTVHCPNTGAMTGCADPGSKVWYSRSSNPKRKYPHTLEAVDTPSGWSGINTSRANHLVSEGLRDGRIKSLARFKQIRTEPAIPNGSGRFDFLLEVDQQSCYVEVKNLTLCDGNGVGRFPDAVSLRARKHVEALRQLKATGLGATLLFCVQHQGVNEVTTADSVDPEYGAAVRAAAAEGVDILAYRVTLSPGEFRLTEALPVTLNRTGQQGS